MKHIIKYLFIMFAVSSVSNCSKDVVPRRIPCEEIVSYESDIKKIIDNNCLDSGCHDGASGVGNYISYRGIKNTFDDRSFEQEVIISKTMPQNGSLTAEQLDLIRCWIDNNYLEN